MADIDNISRSGSFNSQMRPWIISFTTLTIIQMLVTVCLLGVWFQVNQPIPPREETVCLPIGPDDEITVPQNLTSIMENGEIKYCGKASDVITWVIETEMEKAYKAERPKPRLNQEVIPNYSKRTDMVPPIIHRTEIDMKLTKETSNKHSKVYWKSMSGSDASVVIQGQGLYRISSQVMLYTDMDNIRARHALHLKRNGTDTVIMEDREELCKARAEITNEREISTAMDAMFELQNSDELYVTISHPKYIVDNSCKHHFTISLLENSGEITSSFLS